MNRPNGLCRSPHTAYSEGARIQSGPGPIVAAIGLIRGLTTDVTRRLPAMLPYLDTARLEGRDGVR